MDLQRTLENDLDLSAASSLGNFVNGKSFSYHPSIREPRATNAVYSRLTERLTGITPGIFKRKFFAVNSIYDVSQFTSERVISSASPQDKKELQDLNEKFAQYVERITALQLEISPLAKELNELKLKWGSKVEDIKVIYETELSKTRELFNEATKKINELTNKLNLAELEVDKLQQELDLAKALHDDDYEKLVKLTQVTSNLKSELQMFRSVSELNEIENQRSRETIAKYQKDLEKVQLELSLKTLEMLNTTNECQKLQEEMRILKAIHDKERKEWSVLANIDSAVRNREFWKKDLYLAIQEIREEYKAKADQIKGENATAFEIQIQEISTEVQKYQLEATLAREDLSRQQQELMELRNRLADTESSNLMYEKKFSELQRELEIKVTESQSDRERLYLANEEIQKLLEKLNSQKVVTISLQQEIEEYRFWLKRLEESFQELIKFQVSESATRTLSKQQRKFARTFKGPVVIDEIGDEGNYITLRNNSTIPRKDVDLNGWKLKRIVESRSIRRESNEYEYVFQKYVLNSGAQLKVYAKSQEALALPGDLVYEGAETWGAGNRATTILYNESGQERARVEETASFQ
ncbi:70 kDa neurofilament protein-like isoform X2 [Biomphalaria glabrata]|uniref:70 kDa neurofilament protein-like isoform X2 n=1 Tax=Biomphalaria glabrata TaxID=6526 RepID=A0A9W3BEC0_BIOGL|nr:70 kDa neurofilament protein-like isoform X2 [Biomphalaria glabrata]